MTSKIRFIDILVYFVYCSYRNRRDLGESDYISKFVRVYYSYAVALMKKAFAKGYVCTYD